MPRDGCDIDKMAASTSACRFAIVETVDLRRDLITVTALGKGNYFPIGNGKDHHTRRIAARECDGMIQQVV